MRGFLLAATPVHKAPVQLEAGSLHGKEGTPFDILAGNPDPLNLDSYRRMEELGVTDFSVSPWAAYKGDADSLDAKLACMKRFADEVVTKVRPA